MGQGPSQAAKHGEDGRSAPRTCWESVGGKATQTSVRSTPGKQRQLGESRAANLAMENSITQCLDQHWKPLFRFCVQDLNRYTESTEENG